MSRARQAQEAALYVNGRFLGQATSGVQRYAGAMVSALDVLLDEAGGRPFRMAEIIAPQGCAPPPGLKAFGFRRDGRRRGHAWEQLDLAWAARGGVLINLTNSAPLAHRRQVVTIHDAGVSACPENYTLPYRLWYRALYAGLRLMPVQFLTVSAFSAGEIERWHGISGERVAIAPNACEHIERAASEPGILARHGLTPGTYLVAVGGRSPRKNLAAVEAALALLPEPRLPLVVVGHREARVFAAGAGGAGDGLTIEVGHIPDGAVKALYENAMALVFPSLYEGFGLPPLEAMRCGCPVLVSRAASMPEVCGDAARYFDPSSPESIAREILAVSADPALRASMALRGKDRARRYSWRHSAEVLLRLAEAAAA